MNLYKKYLQDLEQIMLGMDAIAQSVGEKNLKEAVPLMQNNSMLATVHSNYKEWFDKSGYRKEVQSMTVTLFDETCGP